MAKKNLPSLIAAAQAASERRGTAVYPKRSTQSAAVGKKQTVPRSVPGRRKEEDRRDRPSYRYADELSPLEKAAINRVSQLTNQYSSTDYRHQPSITPAQNDPLHERMVNDIAATGRLPSGYSWYGKGSNAIAVDNRGLAYKPLEGVTAGSKAATPSVYGIDPDKYLEYMHAYDAWEAEKGNLPEAAKRAQEYLQPAIDAETDPVRKAELQKQLDASIASATYSPAEQRKRNRLEKAAMEAVGYLGEDIGQYAGRSDMDYLRSFGQQFGIQQEGAAYGENYRQPWFQRKGSDAAVHADLMQKLKMGEVYGDINPVDALETGDSQLLQGMSDADKAEYMGIASRYGVDTARAYWDAMRQEGQYRQKAYILRDAAYRDMADKNWFGSSALSVASNVASISGTLYAFAQKMTGNEIDPYADQFMFGQMTGTIRDEVGQNITRNYGNEDGTDNFGSWLMKTGYNAGMSSLDSLVAGKLSGGSALAGSLMQGVSGASSVIQDAKLRGATDEQALLLGGLYVVTETATEYIPMDTLLKTIDGKDVVSFRKLLINALKGGLSEAPGEGLSEILSVISDNHIMGAMSNYNLNVKAYMRTMTEDEARRKASRDVIWDVFNAAATGILSGEGSNLMAGSRSIAINALMPNNTADYQGTVEAVRKLAETTGDAELRKIAEQAGQEMSHTGNVEAAKQGVVDRMMAAVDAVVDNPGNSEWMTGEQQQADPLVAAADVVATKQQQDTGVTVAETENGVSMFDQPMQATTIDGKGAVNVVGFETTQDGKNVILHTVDQAGNRGTALANELEFADDTVQDLLSADDVKGLDGTGLHNYLSDYASEVNGHSVSTADYAKAYGMLYRRAAAGYSIDQAVQGSVIDMVMTPQAMQDAYAAGVGTGQRVAAPAVKGAMNRSFSTSAWNSMTRQQQRTATANMEVVSQLAKRMNATINIVDSLTDRNGKKLNGRYNNKTGVIEIALNADANAYAYVAMHELTHKMRNEHGNSFKTFAEWVKEALESKGQNFEEMVQHQMDTYGYSRAVATEEVLCNTVPALLQSEENLHKLYQQDRTLFERVMDWVKNLINDIKQAGNVLSQRSRNWAQMDALKGDEGTLQALYDVMEGIMQSDTETVANAPAGITEQMLEDNVIEGKVQSVFEAPVNADGEAINYSVSTFEEAMPKPMNMTRAKALGFDTSKKSEVVHGLGRYGKKRTLIASGRDVTEALLRKEYTKKLSSKYKDKTELENAVTEAVKPVLEYMDKVSEWFKKAVGEYQFVNLADVNEASLIVDRDSGEILFSCQVPNAEYKINFDFTTVCRQREAVQRFVDEMSQEQGKRGTKLEDITLTPSNIFKLNTILKDAGYETACLGCFVEARRYRIMSQANTIVDEWNAAVRKLNPKAKYFNFADRNASFTQDEIIKLDAEMEGHRQKVKATDKDERAKTPTARAETLIRNVPEMQRLIRPSDIISRSGRRKIRETSPALESFLVSRFGTAGAKPAVGFMPYNSEIASLPDTKSLGKGKGSISIAEYLFRLGGARSNSFSDSVPTHALDYLQRTIDMAARGFTGQCYTKVLGRAMLFGMTGEKINMSVMFDIDPDVHWSSAGLDADGNYIVADKARADRMEAEGKGRTFVQSFPYEEAIRIEHDPRYADNCGIIGVGYSYRHIEKMLADDNIPYVIPFHRSHMPDSVAKASHTGHATNYEPVQNTKTITGYQRVYNMEDSDGIPSYATWLEKRKNARKVDMDFDFAAAMKRNGGNAKATITEWQNWMAENNLTPMTTAGETGHGAFDLYGSLRRTQDPDATAEEYMKYCIDKGMLPVFYEFAQMDGYYKTLFDFSVRNLATGEVAMQKPVSLDFMDSFTYEDFLAELETEMFEYNEYNRSRFGSASWKQLKERAYRELQPTEQEIEEGEVFSNSVSDFDSAYSAAVEQGDTDKAKELVAQAAEASMPDSKLRTPDGKLRVVYHGTNSGDFTVFDPQFIGMSSGDSGFFGRGFYFAYSNGEASYYGRKRIIPAYLNLTNPFNFQANLHEYNGERTFDYNASNAVALVNFADKFPQIAEKMTIDVARKSDGFEAIPIREFADAYKKVLAETEFTYDEVEGEFGEKETVVLADPEIHEFEYGGEKHTFKDHGFQRRVAGKVDKLSIAYEYLASRVYSSVDVPNFTRVILDHNTEFTAALKEMGYDGVIQSEDGDEAVAFEPSQIKSAEPVTYDDAGKVIPLSERFQTEEQDFRYSMSDYDATVKEGDVVLEDLLTMTAAHKMTDAEAGRMARNVVKTASSTMDTGEVAQRIKTIFDYATRSGERLDVNGLNSEVRALADEIMQRSETLDTEHESEVADLRAYLRKTPIVLSDGQKGEAASMIGSYAAYRRALFGQVSLRKDGIGLDQVWGELSEMYPQLFPKDTTEGDQVRLLMEAAEYAKPVYVNEYGFNEEEAVQWLSNEIFNAYMSLAGVQSAAKEQKELGLKLRDYRRLTKRYASEHKAAYDEAYAKVNSEAESRIAKAEAKAELMANKAISEAQADADYRVIQAKKDIKAKVEARVNTFVEKFNEAERRKRYQAQIVREANSLMKRLEHPTDKSHIQDALQQHVIDFLRDLRIGSRSKQALSLGYRIKELKDVLANPVGNDGSDGGYRYIVDQQLLEEFDLMAKEMEYIHTIDRLDADGMANIRDLVHALVHIVNKADETFAGERKKRISESAELFVAQTDSRKDVKVRDNMLQPVTNFLQVRNLDSFHFFDRLGGEAREMFQQLRNGYDKKIMHRAEAMEFVAGLKDGIDKKAKKDLFAGKRAKKTTYNLDGGSIELSRAQLMELYCLNKREQARKHIYSEKGGIRTMDGRKVTIRQAEMNKLLDNLTAEEKMLADNLQRYLSTECSEWGNETSMTLYGYRKFGEENYWPIRVDGNSIDSNNSMEGKQDNLYALLNMGMTKATLDTVQNAIYIGDIFDTFARHIDNMATYNGLAAPIADLVRWFNYRSSDTNVKEAINFKFGKQYLAYIPQLIRDINGDTGKQDTSSPFDKLFSNAKSSAVGRNVRVLIQQPTALMRAGSMMDYKYIVLGMTGIKGENGRIKLKEASELAKKYCPIAVLKSMGFYETDMGRSMRTAMFDNRTNLEKVKDEGMWMAGKLDEMTFSTLWRACEAETRSVHSDLAVGSEEYYKAVGKRMSEIIDYTQVVDTPLHRTEVMRGKDGLQKIVTSFMSEPSKTYNMLYNATMDLIENRHDPVARRRFVKTMGAFGVTAIVNAAAQSLVDAMRNDDDEEWWKRFCKAFFGDWSNVKTLRDAFRAYMSGNLYDGFDITGMIPYIKDLMSMVQGYDVKRTDLQSVEKLIQVYQNVVKLRNGENKLSGWSWAKQIATSIDSVTGLSLNNALRDGGAFVNLMFEIVGAEPPLKTYHETATPGIAYDNMMAALESGDTKAFERIQAKTGKTNKEVDTEMGNMLAEREDERIVAAYEAKASGRASEYDRLRTEFVEQHGDVVGAERAEEIFDKAVKRYKAIVEDTDEPSDEKDTSPLKVTAYTNKEMGDVFYGLALGTTSRADAELVLSEMIADSTAKDPEKTVRSNLLSQLKPLYIAAPTEEERKAIGEVIKEFCGKTDKDLGKYIEGK